MLPRLTGAWTHLERQVGGIGVKGVGETQIELDRRMIRKKITQLKEELGKITTQRETKRKFRSQHFNVALVGYTNAGKSTLMNHLSEAGVLVENKLFATLDTTVRQIKLDSNHSIYLSDTVGFIQKLPHQLVASFRSTLREVETADLLLKIIDVSDPDFRKHISTIDKVLKDFKISSKQSLTLFNKLDILPDVVNISLLKKDFPEAITISSLRDIGMTKLTRAIKEKMDEGSRHYKIAVDHSQGKLISLLHSQTELISTDNSDPDKVIFEIKCEDAILKQLQKKYDFTILSD